MISYWGIDHGEEISKVDPSRALRLQQSFKAKGYPEALQRRAFSLASRTNRRLAGTTQRHNSQQTMRYMEGRENPMGRAGKRRGVTYYDISNEAFKRSDTGLAQLKRR